MPPTHVMTRKTNHLSKKFAEILLSDIFALIKSNKMNTHTKTIAILSWIVLALSTVWVVLMLLSVPSEADMISLQDFIKYLGGAGVLFNLNYLNAGLLTFAVSLLFAALFAFYKEKDLLCSAIAFAFTPVYALLNLTVYFSQVAVLPAFVDMHQVSKYAASSELWIAMLSQLWPGSLFGFLNAMAYALLGVSSITYGWLMLKQISLLRWAGIMLIFNGILCITGFAGIFMDSEILSLGLMAGAVFFMAAMALMGIGFQRLKK